MKLDYLIPLIFITLLIAFMAWYGSQTNKLTSTHTPVCDAITEECYLVDTLEYSKAIKE